MKITLPWPPSSLSGHAEGSWHKKASETKRHREYARLAAMAHKVKLPETGDIMVKVTFIPPDRKSDRVNYPNRIKPYFDGLADALCVNDQRFLPSYVFAEPEKPGAVVMEVCE